jgi:hypothetical protein
VEVNPQTRRIPTTGIGVVVGTIIVLGVRPEAVIWNPIHPSEIVAIVGASIVVAPISLQGSDHDCHHDHECDNRTPYDVLHNFTPMRIQNLIVNMKGFTITPYTGCCLNHLISV